jgi:NAD(P)H-hydrate epimerase
LVTTGDDRGVRDEVITRVVEPVDLAEAATERIERYGAVVAGPGLGRRASTIDAVHGIVGCDVPLLVDGDGLMAFEPGAMDAAREALAHRTAPVVLTPHDGEFARLAGQRVADDRFSAVRRLAADLGCVVLSKGPTSVLADPHGSLLAVDHGDERLATAGSGDVLSGIIGALLARGVPALLAAAAGAWVHAEAGRRWLPAGLLAGDLVDALPSVLTELT